MTLLKILMVIALAFAAKVLFFDDRSDSGSAQTAAAGKNSVTGRFPMDIQYLQGAPVQPGKPVLVGFWATWCGPCVQTIPHLNQIHARHRQQGLQIVAISNEKESKIRQFMGSHPMAYPVAMDPNNRYFSAYRVRGIPRAFLFDASGRQVWTGHPGSLTPATIQKAL